MIRYKFDRARASLATGSEVSLEPGLKVSLESLKVSLEVGVYVSTALGASA